jgi:hypothetical protein
MAINNFVEVTNWHKKLREKHNKQDGRFSFHYVELRNKKSDGNTEMVDQELILFQWF